MNTLEVLKKILTDNCNIVAYKLHTFPRKSLLQEIIKLEDEEVAIVEGALNIREKYRLPFWDSIMLFSFDNERYSRKILHQALHHNKRIDYYDVSRTEFLSDKYPFSAEERLAINSKIVLEHGKIEHIPMLDFHIPVSECNLRIVKDVLFELNVVSGYLLNSGESYHFIGDYRINEESLLDFLANALFFAPIIDRAWIGHQILERSCSLRIDKKHGVYPEVICYIDKR